eukprot:TRINITY_DN10874_c0_g1_i10.p3 TRINITY_DN10874_c0_g1~~TRINITY_DN10874_c0_g1_i10.p3  ORF type:complete len:178 (+),score=20.76 TRINITY_DN10874_c0_g1_i10:1739-2272(+)
MLATFYRRSVGAVQRAAMTQPLRALSRSTQQSIDMDANILQGSEGPLNLIQRFGTKGFTINGHKYYGPMVVLSHIHLNWGIKTAQDITADSLTAFRLYHPRPDVVVVGTGDKVERLDPQAIQAMKECGIVLEVQDTRHACATFNFLSQEGRRVAAALIPPAHFKPIEVVKRTRSKIA